MSGQEAVRLTLPCSPSMCTTWLGYQFHRHPCGLAGQIDDLTVPPADETEPQAGASGDGGGVS